MSGTRIHALIEGQVAVRLDWRKLPDLDDLMLDILQERIDSGDDYIYIDDDEPTTFNSTPEPDWQWTKISPCWCGEHGWHWDSRRVPDEKDLIEDRPRYRFIAMEWFW